MKKILINIVRVLLVFLLSITILFGIMRDRHVQSFIAQVGSVYLSEYLGTKVWFDRFLLSSDLRLEMENVHILDHHQHTLISAKSISADYHLIRFDADELPIHNVKLDSAFVNIVNYAKEDDLNINILLNKIGKRKTDTVPSTNTPPTQKIRIALGDLQLSRSRFVYRQEGKEEHPSYRGMDYNHLDLQDLETELKDIHIVNDSITAQIVKLSTHDRCGFKLKHLEGHTKVWSQGIELKDGNVNTALSQVHLDLSFTYNEWKDYLDFIDKVYMEANLHRSRLNLQDIAYFAPSMWGMYNPLNIKGKVKGTVKNLRGRRLKINFGRSINFQGDVDMFGLPNIYETFVLLDIKNFTGEIKDLKKFRLPEGERIEKIPEILERLGKIRLKGQLTGFYNDFVSNALIFNDMGTLHTDLQITHDFAENRVHYQGAFAGTEFDIGKFTNNGKHYGIVNFNLNLKGKGIELKTLDSQVEGQIDGLAFNGNKLNSILVDAVVKDKLFNGSLHLEDELVKAHFIGKADFNKQDAAFNFTADLQHLKAGKLGLMGLDSSTDFSTHIRSNFVGSKIDDMLGHLFIDSMLLYYKDKNYRVQTFELSALMDSDSTKRIRLQSDIVDVNMLGKFTLSALPNFGQTLLHQYINQIPTDSTYQQSPQNFRFNIKFKQANTLAELLIPTIQISDSLHINGEIYSTNKKINIQTNTAHLHWNGLHFTQPRLHVFTKQNQLHEQADIDELWWQEAGDADSLLRLGLDSIRIESAVADNILEYQIQWHNTNPHQRTQAHIPGHMYFAPTQGFNISLDSAWVYVNNALWHINNPNAIALDSLGIFKFNRLNIYSDQQEIGLNGDISTLPQQQLQVKFKHFDVSVFNILGPLMGNLSFGGQLNGQVRLNSYATTPNILAALWLETFVFNGTTMGDLNIQSDWKTDETLAIQAYLEKQGNKQAFLPFEISGEYEPQTNKIDAQLKTWQLPLDFVNPFLEGLVSNLKGKANGSAQIKGTLFAPEIEGKIRLERSEFKIDYLNTTYALSGNLLIDNNSIGFKQTNIYDTLGNTAVLNGGLTHRYLDHFGVDLQVTADHFSALNTTANMNSLFYGSGIVSGNLLFKGPFDNIFMQLRLESNAGSRLFIPLNSISDITDNEFIIFTNTADSTNAKKETTRQLSPFTLDMQLKVTPETEISISMPEDLGTINAQGRGMMDMNMSRTGNFSMSGDYTVQSGEFFFNMRNLFNRRFALQKGGNISWTGDPYDGRLNMTAAYNLKTSLSGFDNSGDSSQRIRVPVECIIGLNGQLTNPDLRFKVNMPNTTEDVRQYVYSQIDTTNQAQMSQQMLSLLILNSFNFSNSALGSGNMSANMSGSTMQIFTNQIGNLLSNISDNVDVGINYVPGSNTGNEELEVALSTQLFDDRISIDGNFGYQNTRNNIQKNTPNLIGDITVEMKLRKDGNWRLKVFNKTNTVDLLDNTSPYTQGVGVFYRQSFNRFSDLFKPKRPKIKKQK